MDTILLLGGVLVGIVLTLIPASLYYLRIVRAERQRTAEINRLNEIGVQLLRVQLNVDDLCELVYVQSRDIIPTALFQLGLFYDDAYTIKVWVKDGQRLPERTFPDGGRRGIASWVKQNGHPLLVHDFLAERDSLPAFPEWESDDPPRSGVFVPLIAGSSTIGLLAIQSRKPNYFTEEHVRLLTALANQAAFAIRNAQLFENARRRAEQLNLIGQTSTQISAIQPLDELFEQIVVLTKSTFGYYVVSIYLYDGHDRLTVGASTSQKLAERLPHIKLGVGLMGWSAQKGQTAIANKVVEDPRYRGLDVLPETKSEIVLPLIAEGRVLGVLDVQSNTEHAFASEDVFLLETLAAQIAVAIEQAQSYAAKVETSQRLQALTRVTQAVVSVLDLDDLLEQVVDLVGETFDYERVHIFVRIEQQLIFRAGVGPHSVRWLVEELAYAINGPGLIAKVARSGEAILVDDVTTAPDYKEGPYIEDTRSEMVVPIRIGTRVLGVIDVQSPRIHAFSEADLKLIQSLADSVAVAMRNAALYVSEKRRRNVSETLREISASIASNLDLDAVLTAILEGLSVVLDLHSSAIMLVDDNRGLLEVAAVAGDDIVDDILGRQISLMEVDTNRLEEAISARYMEFVGHDHEDYCITVPLSVSSGLIGFLVVDTGSTDPHSENTSEIIWTFAHQAAIAINNARLYASQQAEAWVTTALLQVAEAVNTEMEVTDLLSTIARLTSLLVGVDQCLIFRWDRTAKGYYLTASFGVDADQAAPHAEKPILARNSPYLDLMTVSEHRLGAGEGHQLPIPQPLKSMVTASSIIGFPLQSLGDPVGLLIVDDPWQGLIEPNQRQLKILTGIAHQAATTLETAALQASAAERDRLEREIAVARSIQASFMPDKPPRLPGWQISAAWRAARQVGGDFYDFIQFPDGRWGLVMADVADKGIPAALFMAMCRTLLRAVAMERRSPAATLLLLNEVLISDNNSDLFVTMFYAIWDPQTGDLTYASGGHNPSIKVAADGSLTELRSRGVALGIISDIEIDEHTSNLAPGETLVSYTDGVTEAMQQDYTEWGLERFEEALSSAHTHTAEDIVSRVLWAVDGFVAGAAQNDDLTIWVLKRSVDQGSPSSSPSSSGGGGGASSPKSSSNP